jgi:MYXO-CTERM domain-containing protein
MEPLHRLVAMSSMALTLSLWTLPAAAAGAGGVAGAGGLGAGALGAGGLATAGAGGAAGGAPGTGGLDPGGGIGGRSGTRRDDGCSCRVAGSPKRAPMPDWVVWSMVLAGAWRRRRTR